MKRTVLFAALGLASAALASPETDAVDRRALADAMFSRKAYKGAAEEYSAVLRDFPNGAETAYVTYRLGEALRLAGDTAGAIDAYSKVVAMPENDYSGNARVQSALLMLSSNRAADAERMFREIIDSGKTGPLRENALYGRARALTQLGRADEAAASLEAFLSDFPQSQMRESVISLLGSIYGGSAGADGKPRDAARAIALYNSAAESGDASVSAWALREIMVVARADGDYKTVADTARKLFAKHPEAKSDVPVALCAAYAFLKTQCSTEAIELCEAAAGSADAATAADFDFYRGQALFQLSRFDDAHALLSRIAEGGGAHAKAARLKDAGSLYCAGRYEECRAAAKPLLAEDGDLRMEALYLSAGAAQALHDTDGALNDYNLLVSNYPKSKHAPEAVYNLACALSAKGNHPKAAAAFVKLTQLFPGDSRVEDASYSAATEFQAAGMKPEAIERWRVFIRDFPGSKLADSALYNEAKTFYDLENFTEALAAVDSLLGRFPQSKFRAAALYMRGVMKSKLGDDASAIAAYREAIAASGDDAALRDSSNFNLAVLLRKTGAEDEAAAIFSRLLSDGGKIGLSTEQLEWLVVFQLERGDSATAVKAARTMVEKAGDDALRQKAWALAGRSERAAKRAREAEEAYRVSADMNVNTIYKVEASLRLAELLLARGDTAGAETYFTRTLELCGSNEKLASSRIEARVGLGETYLAQGKKEEAVRHMRFVCVFEPDREISRRVFPKLIDLLGELGRADEAAEMRAAFESIDEK